MGCQGIGYRDADYYAMAVYATLFGGGMSSRLFQRIREDRGLVYGIHCFNAAYADGGLFGIYAGTGEDDLGELVPAVCTEFVGVADTITEAELVRARNQIKAGTLMALEPAFGTLWGILLLHQVPDLLQVAGVALVVCAGIGAERTGHRQQPDVLAPQIT